MLQIMRLDRRGPNAIAATCTDVAAVIVTCGEVGGVKVKACAACAKKTTKTIANSLIKSAPLDYFDRQPLGQPLP